MITFPAFEFPKVLLLDLDGTLADSLPALKNAYFRFTNDHGIQGSDDEYSSLIGPALPEIVRTLKDRHGLPHTEERLYENYMLLLSELYALRIQPFAGAQSLLDFLSTQGTKMAIVTSAPRDLVRKFLEAQRWTDYFGETICGDEVARAKPYPDIYLAALAKLHCLANEVIAVEDSLTGVQAAAAAGIAAIGVSAEAGNISMLSQAGAYNVVEDLYALKAYLSEPTANQYAMINPNVASQTYLVF